MILGDRVMMNGSGRGNDDFGELRRQAFAFVARAGRLSARIDDPFYGELKVYRITYDSAAIRMNDLDRLPRRDR
jgi:hypothetical protein